VESLFASVRLRTSAAKRFKRVDSATTLIWKVLRVAESRFRKVNVFVADVFTWGSVQLWLIEKS
jgi:hypothetical protein